MNPYYVADQILQYSLNALTGFIILAALTAAAIKIFKIHNPRLKASLRMIAPLRLILEPLFWINPFKIPLINISFFSCSHPLQLYFYSFLPESSLAELNKYGLKSTAGIALLQIPETVLWALIAAFFITIIFRLAMLLKGFIESIEHVSTIKKNSRSFNTENSPLNLFLKNQKIAVFVSDGTKIPFAGWNNTIILPSSIVQEYTQSELDAVIAHESEHLVRKDMESRFVIRFIASIFWWVPLKKWNDQIVKEQEFAADASIHSHALDRLNLATALQKSIQTNFSGMWLAAFSALRHQAVVRIQTILSPDSSNPQSAFTTRAVILFLLALLPIITFIVC